MLFLGTEKYPNESEYGDFINEVICDNKLHVPNSLLICG